MLMLSTEGERMAQAWGCPFIETSAKSRLNVEDAFYETVREIRRYNKEMTATTNGLSKNGSPIQKMEHDNEKEDAGCCGGCTLM